GALGTLFGFPGFSATLGPPFGNTGSHSAAGTFPGVGSPFGSILPGIVLATSTLPATLLTQQIIVPATYTVAPTYLPDAPFINRLYGQSSFSDFVAGAKIRFTGPHNPIGLGLVAYYKWYADKGGDLSGFNQLQRGASPGAGFGDIAVIFVADGRLS